MASQMKASVILGYSRHNDCACPVSTGRRRCQCPSAVRDSAGETAADRVLGVAPERALEDGYGSRPQAEQRELGFERVTRRDMEQPEPLPQADPEPAGQPLLTTEIDDMQLAARGHPAECTVEHRLPARHHRE